MKKISLIIAMMVLALASQAQLLWKVSGNGLATSWVPIILPRLR